MFVRKLRREEEWLAHRIQAIAFEFPFDQEKAKSECQEPREQKPNDGLPRDPRAPFIWAAGEEDEVYGCVGISSYPVRFDGHTVLMGGVGGVSTLPQHRRGGVIRSCMQAALEDMYENGYVLSALYPFSTAYYRQYGYECGADVSLWTIPLGALKLPDAGGKVDMLLPGDDLSELCEVYNAACRDWNLSSVRSEFSAKLAKSNWLNDKRYLYLWRGDDGRAQSFMLMKKMDGVMDCSSGFALDNALFYENAQALSALLKFAGAFAADYDSIRLMTPANIHVDALISDGGKAERKTSYNGMLRIVNVRRTLELCRTRGEGCVRIAVTDPMLEQNCGVWQVTFGQGGENRVERTDGAADVELSIGQLSQLVLGVRSARDLSMMPGAKVSNPDAPLENIFFEKTCMMLDLF